MRSFVAVLALVVGTFAAPAAGSANRHALPACSVSAMTLRVGGLVSEKTQQHTLPLVLTSRAATPCVLDGYPSVALFDREGRLLPFRYTHQGDQMITSARPRPVEMRLGTSAYFALNKNACALFTTRVARTLQLRLPGGREFQTIRLRHYPILDYCGRGFFARVTASPFVPRPSGWACDSQGSCLRRG
jgi:hypothetical protein